MVSHHPIRRLTWIFFLVVSTAVPTKVLAQSTGYLLPQEQGLEMVVHIIGEVAKPGEYRVPDRTDLLELVSKAGGPTEFASLGSVVIRRVMPLQQPSTRTSSTRRTTSGQQKVELLEVDLRRTWHREDEAPPRLLPGDVIVVPRNSWFGYRRTASVLRDVAVVASAVFLYLRVVNED